MEKITVSYNPTCPDNFFKFLTVIKYTYNVSFLKYTVQ